MRVFIFVHLLSESFLIPIRIKRDVIRTYGFMKNTRNSCQILMNLEFSREIFEILNSNFMKIYSLGAELFCVDGQT